MLDIYPLSDHESDNYQEQDEEVYHSEFLNTLKNSIKQPDRNNVFLRFNMFPKFSEGARKMSKHVENEKVIDQNPTARFTTHTPLESEEDKENDEDEK